MNAPLKALNFEDPVASHARAMLEELGEDPRREGLANTPARYAKAMRYLAGGYASDVASVVGEAVFAAEGQGVVVVRDVEFHSLCEHHLLPFYGRVHVGYLPAQRIIGLSKIPRIVDLFARRFQVQERLTQQVADALVEVLEPNAVVVTADARHMCMAMRGVQKQRSCTLTRATRGANRQDIEEILSMMKGS